MKFFGKDKKKKYPMDRRIFVRIPVKLPLRFFAKKGEKEKRAEILNISANGIGFTTKTKLSPNTPLKMWVNMPQYSEPLCITGNVIWCKKPGIFTRLWRAGVQLERADLIGLGKILAQEIH